MFVNEKATKSVMYGYVFLKTTQINLKRDRMALL